MADWQELAGFVQTSAQSVLGEDATYTHPGGAPESIRGIFTDERAEAMLTETGMGVSSSRPILSVHLADLAQYPVEDASVEVRGQTYRVAEIQPDGEGDADLLLHVTP